MTSSIRAINILTNQITAVSSLTQEAYITNIYNSSLQTSSILTSSIRAINIVTNQITAVSSLTQDAYITNIYNSSLQTSSILTSSIRAINIVTNQITAVSSLTQEAYITNIYNSSLQTSSILTSSIRAINIVTNQLTAVSSLTQDAYITNIFNSSIQTSSILTSSIRAVSVSTNLLSVYASAIIDGTLDVKGATTLPGGVTVTGNIKTAGTDAVAFGNSAGTTSQGLNAVAIGVSAGQTSQGVNTVAIGKISGNTSQGQFGVAVGYGSANNTQGEHSIAIGRDTANANQGTYAVAIGYEAGRNTQNTNAIAIGSQTGRNSQGIKAVAIGNLAALDNQGESSVAIGFEAGKTSQSTNSIAIGYNAANLNQHSNAIAIGWEAGKTRQSTNTIAIGYKAGNSQQGSNAIAIGTSAGQTNQASNSIIINASATALDNTTVQGLFVKPIRAFPAASYLKYDNGSGEITYSADNNISVGTLSRFLLVGNSVGRIVVTNDYGTTYLPGVNTGLTTLTGLKTDGKVIVAVGTSSGFPIFWSSDRITWTPATGTITTVNDLIWTGTQFVAVGNVFATSPDGKSWTTVTLPTSDLTTATAVAFNGYYYIISSAAVGTAKCNIFRYDPSTSTIIKIATEFTSINRLFWTGSTWLIGGAGSYNLASYNSGTQVVGISLTSSTPITSIASDGKRIVATGTLHVYYSDNGVSWTSVPINDPIGSIQINDIVWDGTRFVIFYNGGNKLATSVNGASWVFATFATTDIYRGVAFRYSAVQTQANNGLLATDSISTTGFVTIGDSLRVGQSTLVVQDSTRSMGINCNSPSYPVDVNGVINAKFIYQDGAPYQPPPTASAVTIVNITASTITVGKSASIVNTTVPAIILIAGQTTSGYMLYTGTTPTNMARNISIPTTATAFNAAYYTGTNWYIGGVATSAVLYSSPDSVTWTQITPLGSFPTSLTSAVNAIVYNGSYYLICCLDATTDKTTAASLSILKSTDMATFSASSTVAAGIAFKSGAYMAAWNGNLWVAVGSDNTSTTPVTIKYSYDGFTWNNTVNSFNTASTSTGYTVVWNGVLFVAGGTDTTCTLKYSTDGLTWYNCKGSYAPTSSTGHREVTVVWSGKRFVAVHAVIAAGFNIFYSDDGITWSGVQQSIINAYSLVWTGSEFIIGTSFATGVAPFLYVSTDGITWAQRTPTTSYDTGLIMNSLAYSYNTVPDLKLANTNFFSKQPQFQGSSSNTNTVLSLSNGFLINNLYSETSGKVGINNNNPKVALDVNGDMNVSKNITTNSLTVSGNMGVNALPSNQYNTTVGGTSAFVKDSTFFGNTTIAGSLSTTPVVFAGSGAGAFTAGNGVLARFDSPYGCVVGQDGTIYVLNNSTTLLTPSICKITPAGAVTLLAGSGRGTTDSSGSSASFYSPYLATLGSDGSLYVSDNLRIRRVTTLGEVTTVYTNANIIGGICIDASGNIYFTEPDAFTIKKLTPTGVLTVLAGSGTQFITDGTGTVASFYAPRGLTIDLQGNMYVGDNHLVRKVTSAGVVSILAGRVVTNSSLSTLLPTTSLLLTRNSTDTGSNPQTVTQNGDQTKITYTTIGGKSCAYFDNTASPYNNYISVPFTASTTAEIPTTVSGSFTISYWIYTEAITASYSSWGLASTATPTSGTIGINGVLTLTPTQSNQTINLRFKLSPYGVGNENTVSLNLSFTPLTWTHVTLTVNNISVTQCECKLYKDGAQIGGTQTLGGPIFYTSYLIIGKSTHTPAGFKGYLTNFNVFNSVLSPANITTLSQDTNISYPSGNVDGQGTTAGFNTIQGMTCDMFGNIYVADSLNYKIRKVTPTGLVTTVATASSRIVDVKFDLAGNLFYTNDTGFLNKISNNGVTLSNGDINFTGNLKRNNTTVDFTPAGINSTGRIGINKAASTYELDVYGEVKFTSDIGTATAFVGSGVAGPFTLGTGLSAILNMPYSCAIGPDNIIYLVNKSTYPTICKIIDGVVSLLAGSTTANGYVDSSGASATFTSPTYITYSSVIGALLVTDGTKIRKITTAGVVTTVFTHSSTIYGICVDSLGNIFFSDNNDKYNKLSPPYAASTFITNLNSTYACTIDSQNNVYYITGTTITKITSQNVVSTLAGSTSGYADGQGTNAKFGSTYGINGITCDASGNVYVTDTENLKIRKITPEGLVTTIANCTASQRDLKFDSSGNIFSPDSTRNILYKYNRGVTTLATNLGYVGINTNSPAYHLDVNGNLRASGNLTAGNTNINGKTVISSPLTYTDSTTPPFNGKFQLELRETGFGQQRLYLGAAYTATASSSATPGSDCVIQSSDYYNLEDHGKPLRLNPLGGEVSCGANFTATGNVTAYSDIRAKENIVTIDSPLDKIMKMRGVYYTRKDTEIERKRQIGVIAQEVEEVLPEVVMTDTSEDKKKSVAYGNIVALLIEGMKEQQKQIEAQQSTINYLLTRI